MFQGWTLRAICCAAVVCIACGPVLAQSPGDIVVAGRAADLKIEDAVVTSVHVGQALVVEQTQGDWLWVRTADGQTGWIQRSAINAPSAETVSPVPAISPQSSAGADRIASPAAEPGSQTPATGTVRPAEGRARVQPQSGLATDQPSVSPAEALLPPQGLAGQPAIPPDAPAEDDGYLYVIGALAGSHVYTTYAYTGLLADGLSQGVYTADHVVELASEVATVSGNLSAHLGRLESMGMTSDDAAAVRQMQEIYTLLGRQASALVRFAESGSQSDARSFEEARTAVWPKIAALLGLE